MLVSKLSNRDGSLDVDISSDLPSSKVKTVNNLTQILRISNKTLWMVLVKKNRSVPLIYIKNYHIPLSAVLCRIRIHFCWKTTQIWLGRSLHFACTFICQ